MSELFRSMDRSNWNEIKRGHIFDAAMFYNSDTKRPLTFFIPDGELSEGEPITGKLIAGNGDFSPVYEGGIPKLQEHQVVVGMKNRRVVVLSNDFFNQNPSYEYIYVAPIMSVHDKDRSKKWYQKMIHDEHPTFVYVPVREDGYERYVNITQIASIHKGTLLRNMNEVIDGDRMDAINNSLLDCFDLGMVEVEEDEMNEILEVTGTED